MSKSADDLIGVFGPESLPDCHGRVFAEGQIVLEDKEAARVPLKHVADDFGKLRPERG